MEMTQFITNRSVPRHSRSRKRPRNKGTNPRPCRTNRRPPQTPASRPPRPDPHTSLYNVLEKLRHDQPLNDKEKTTHQQGLVAILRELDLDRAVFNAYGWDDSLATPLVSKPGATTPLPDKPEAQAWAEEQLLSRLVDLNARATEEAQGHIRWLRPDFQAPELAAAPIGSAQGEPLSQREADTAKAACESVP
ncbi:MAG: hypothetical protein R3E95_01580 [Thiolinea sp.]